MVRLIVLIIYLVLNILACLFLEYEAIKRIHKPYTALCVMGAVTSSFLSGVLIGFFMYVC